MERKKEKKKERKRKKERKKERATNVEQTIKKRTKNKATKATNPVFGYMSPISVEIGKCVARNKRAKSVNSDSLCWGSTKNSTVIVCLCWVLVLYLFKLYLL